MIIVFLVSTFYASLKQTAKEFYHKCIIKQTHVYKNFSNKWAKKKHFTKINTKNKNILGGKYHLFIEFLTKYSE